MRPLPQPPSFLYQAAAPWEFRQPVPQGPLLASLLLHIAVAAALMEIPPSTPLRPTQPIRDLIRAESKKITWYRLQPLPKVSAPPEVRRAPKSRGAEKTRLQAALADLRAPAAKQFIWTPVPAPILRDVPAPDLIKMPANRLVLEPPPKAPSKQFVPPPPKPAEPKPAVRPALVTELIAAAPVDLPKLPVSASANLPPAPKPVEKPPTPEAPPNGAGGTDNVAVAILNSSPAAVEAPEVTGTRRGEISRAGETGQPAVRADEGGVRVPGIAVEAGGTPAPKSSPTAAPPKPARDVIVYQASQLGGAQNSISAPLRPFVRAIPSDIEKFFTGRNVYSMIVPMANMKVYKGDWVMWFGERGANTREGRVKAPLPRAKGETVREVRGGRLEEGRVKARIVVESDGSVKEVILSCSNLALNARAAQDLMEWEFRPATKDGNAFPADVILEYTFRAEVESP